VKDVAEYIFYEDGLYRYIEGVPKPNERKNAGVKKAIDFIELVLITNTQEGEAGKEIILSRDLSLGNIKKYLFDLIDVEGKARSMPLHYRVKANTTSKGNK